MDRACTILILARTLSFLFVPLSFLALKGRIGRISAYLAIMVNMIAYFLFISGIDITTGWFWLYNGRKIALEDFLAQAGVGHLRCYAKLYYLLKGFYGIDASVSRIEDLQGEGLSIVQWYSLVEGHPILGRELQLLSAEGSFKRS